MRTVSRVPPKPAQIPTGTTAKPLAFDGILAYVGLAILLVSAVFWADATAMREKTDFSVTYIGSRMVYLGQGRQLYDLAEQRKLKAALLKDAEPLIYEHPPFEALLLAPLGALPYKTAYLLWGLINVAIFLTLPRLLRPYATAPRDELAYLALWLLFAPLGVALYQGQSSIVLLLVYALTFSALKQGRDGRAGAILGLGLFKFQFILPFVLIFVLRRQWRFLKGFLATAAGLGVLSVVRWMVGRVELCGDLLAGHCRASGKCHVRRSHRHGHGAGIRPRRAGKSAGRIPRFLLLVAAISLGLIGWSAWRWPAAKPRRRWHLDKGNLRTGDLRKDFRGRGFDLMFSVAVVVALVAGFHMFTHDLSPLLLAMLLVLAHFPERAVARGGHRLRITLAVTLTAFWIPPLYFALLAWHVVYLWFPVLMLFMVGTYQLSEASPCP